MSDQYDDGFEVVDGDEGYCQDCGMPISFNDGTAYVTASGDVYCLDCGQQADEDQEEADWEDGYDDFEYSTGYDMVEGEEYGVDISPDNDTMGGAS